MNDFLRAFEAFNVNAINSLVFAIGKSIWYILGIVALGILTYFDVKAHVRNEVKDERRII